MHPISHRFLKPCSLHSFALCTCLLSPTPAGPLCASAGEAAPEGRDQQHPLPAVGGASFCVRHGWQRPRGRAVARGARSRGRRRGSRGPAQADAQGSTQLHFRPRYLSPLSFTTSSPPPSLPPDPLPATRPPPAHVSPSPLLAMCPHHPPALPLPVQLLHGTRHTAGVYATEGLRGRSVVLSVAADKRILGCDAERGGAQLVLSAMLDSRLTDVLANPVDFNLFLVQSGTPCEQLRLYDFRAPRKQQHIFGWEQSASDSQSALISSCWAPSGLQISVGSADPKVHIFDVRWGGMKPLLTVDAHDKRVFKAAWHPTQPLIVSIASDLNIGLNPIRT
ncbi:unnamed protein product [Closterium sp. Yama58-4]|nr:unnamed protein product [Closterium sp. Yama58-4]